VKPLGDRKRHYWLAKRMAKATGADIVGAHATGALPQEEWARMVQTCRGCDWTDGCQRWLQANPAASDAPAACPNCGRFADLQAV
jgi:hypothetical protein